MSRSTLLLPDNAKTSLLTHGFEDDFYHLSDTLWSQVESDNAGTVAHDADGVGGLVTLSAGAAGTEDNDECYLATPEVFQIAAGKPIEATAIVQFAEANTNTANVVFGLLDGWGANTLLDNGGGMKASFDGAVIYKADGETRWRGKSSNGAANQDDILDHVAGQAAPQTLRILIMPTADGFADVSYWVDQLGGNNLRQARAYAAHPRTPDLKHRVAIANQTQIALGFGVKCGADASTEVLTVDYASCFQAR